MARRGTHETEVVGELNQIKKGLEELRSGLMAEVADVEAGITRIDVAIKGGKTERTAAPSKRRKRTNARRKAGARKSTRGSRKTTASASSNGHGDLGFMIVDAITKAQKPMAAGQVAKRLGILDATARRHLSALAKQGTIKKAGMHKAGPGRAAQLYAAK